MDTGLEFSVYWAEEVSALELHLSREWQTNIDIGQPIVVPRFNGDDQIMFGSAAVADQFAQQFKAHTGWEYWLIIVPFALYHKRAFVSSEVCLAIVDNWLSADQKVTTEQAIALIAPVISQLDRTIRECVRRNA